MNITSFLIYCVIVTFTPGPANIVILYFLNCKIEFAKQLIEKNKDIYSAVAACGFVDLTHLNKHFKRIYGVTAFELSTSFN